VTRTLLWRHVRLPEAVGKLILIGAAAFLRKGNKMIRLALLIGAVAVALGTATVATAGGLTPSTLINAGWTCFNDPGAPRVVCSDPGHGRPVIPAPPDRPESYNFKIFSLDGMFTGTAHLIRDDLYQGQPCPQTGGLYFPIAVIGYYRCEHF
jgi:hypothetical protein